MVGKLWRQEWEANGYITFATHPEGRARWMLVIGSLSPLFQSRTLDQGTVLSTARMGLPTSMYPV